MLITFETGNHKTTLQERS